MIASRSIGRTWILCFEIVVCIIVGVTASNASAAQATLAWDPNTESDLAGYRIHYGTASGSYTVHTDVHNVTTYTVTGLTAGQTYYFAATAYDASGNESGYSNPVSYAVPSANGAPTTPSVSYAVAALNDANDFSTDSRSQYTVANTWTQSGVGQFLYDATGKRLQVKTGDNVALLFSRVLPAASASGVLKLDFLPTVKYPYGGEFVLRLEQDANNYYEVYNSDGYGAGRVSKVVNGQEVGSAAFASGYVQNTGYTVTVTFSATAVRVEGFGAAVVLSQNSSAIAVSSFEVELCQQDAYIDNIYFSSQAASNLSPTAEAGPDQVVNAAATVALDGSGSRDTDGTIVSYLWEQTAGPGVTLSGSGAQRSFTAPSTAATLTFRLTVTDDDGATGADTVTVTVQPVGSLSFADIFSTDSRSQYTVANTWTQGGVGQFLYDATGKRLQVKTGDNIALEFSRSLPAASSTGVLKVNFLPTVKYPYGGEFALRLEQDGNNYYEVYNSDGYGPGRVSKVVNGQVVGSAAFSSGYVQNTSYTITVTFSAGSVRVEGFGGAVVLSQNSSAIAVSRFKLELCQQDAYIDNFLFQ